MDVKVTRPILDFTEKFSSYDQLPPEVVHEVKRTLLDGLGAALGGIATDKGKIGVQMARAFGGKPEATLFGVGGKFPAAVAAFANAELLNALDFDPIPHVPPVVLPSVLAVAEAEGLPGKKLLSALAIGQELAMRFNNIFGMVMIRSYEKYHRTPDVFSNGNDDILGAAVGNAVAMGLDREKNGACAGHFGLLLHVARLPRLGEHLSEIDDKICTGSLARARCSPGSHAGPHGLHGKPGHAGRRIRIPEILLLRSGRMAARRFPGWLRRKMALPRFQIQSLSLLQFPALNTGIL